MTTLLQTIGIVESVIILVLAEPVLNRMSPCAPLLIRWSFHAVAMGSACRLYHILSGHPPSWSSLLQVGGLTALLLLDQLRRYRGARPENAPPGKRFFRREDDWLR